MDTVSNDIIIKKAENIDTDSYKKINDLMQLTSDVLNPNNITLNNKFPALECEMGTLTLSAKITQKKRRKTLEKRLNEINENPDIQKTILQAKESGELNTNKKSKILGLLKIPDYKNLPDEGKKEVISKCLSFQSHNNDPFGEIPSFSSFKYNPSENSIDTSINIVIELIKNLAIKLDVVRTDYLATEQSKQFLQELGILQDKINFFIKKCGDINE